VPGLAHALTVVALCGMVAGCMPRRTVALESGTYAPADEPGTTLRLDLGSNRARLEHAGASVELVLERIEDPRAWPTDCGTMTGPTHVELAHIVPPGFDLAGVRHPYDGIRADCGIGVELVVAGHSETWRFTRVEP
jgi:hypothetical protein